MLRDFIFDSFLRIFYGRDRLEHCLDLLHSSLCIYITYHHNSLKVSTIPVVIEIAEGLRLECVDDVVVTDHIALRILGILVDDRIDLETDSEARITSGSPLL